MKAYGEKHLLACRLYLNIGILYEDNRDFQMAYDYFVKWHATSYSVSLFVFERGPRDCIYIATKSIWRMGYEEYRLILI